MRRIYLTDGNELTCKDVEGYYTLTEAIEILIRPKDKGRYIQRLMSKKENLRKLAQWERDNNPDFNNARFDELINGKRVYMNPTRWVRDFNAKGMLVDRGWYGGCFVVEDILKEILSWLGTDYWTGSEMTFNNKLMFAEYESDLYIYDLNTLRTIEFWKTMCWVITCTTKDESWSDQDMDFYYWKAVDYFTNKYIPEKLSEPMEEGNDIEYHIYTQSHLISETMKRIDNNLDPPFIYNDHILQIMSVMTRASQQYTVMASVLVEELRNSSLAEKIEAVNKIKEEATDDELRVYQTVDYRLNVITKKTFKPDLDELIDELIEYKKGVIADFKYKVNFSSYL